MRTKENLCFIFFLHIYIHTILDGNRTEYWCCLHYFFAQSMNSRLDYLDDKGHESIKKENKKLNIVYRTGIICVFYASSFYWIWLLMLAHTVYIWAFNVHHIDMENTFMCIKLELSTRLYNFFFGYVLKMILASSF